MNICQLTRLSNTAIRNTRGLILSILTTFLVILIWSPSTGFSEADHMSWQEINTLEKEGHDIGAHTITHRSLTEIPPEEMKFEVSESKQCLIDNGIEDVNYFSYPKNEGSADKAVVETVSQNYDLARTANGPLMYLRCNGFTESTQDDCRTYTEDGELTFVNRYSIMGWLIS